MIKIDPGAIVFTRGFSLERTHTVGKQITIEKLIKKAQSYDDIQGNDYAYKDHVHVK